MLGQRQQQQVEERQRHTHQDVLHRVHTQVLQHLEQEEAGKGQGDEQQGVFDCPLALQVLVHRVNEAHTKAALAEIGALPGCSALAQGVFEVGGEERGLPVGTEALRIDIAAAGQVVADEARVRPVGAHVHAAGTAHGYHVQLAGTLQRQVKAIAERSRL
ncbi:hypothetical protein D3C76_696340 [compost metagenome]